MNDNIIDFPPSPYLTPEQALASASKFEDFSDVIVIGINRTDGELIVRSSHMTRAEALFYLEMAKRWAMGDSR